MGDEDWAEEALENQIWEGQPDELPTHIDGQQDVFEEESDDAADDA
jgi:hypothetical protein